MKIKLFLTTALLILTACSDSGQPAAPVKKSPSGQINQTEEELGRQIYLINLKIVVDCLSPSQYSEIYYGVSKIKNKIEGESYQNAEARKTLSLVREMRPILRILMERESKKSGEIIGVESKRSYIKKSEEYMSNCDSFRILRDELNQM